MVKNATALSIDKQTDPPENLDIFWKVENQVQVSVYTDTGQSHLIFGAAYSARLQVEI